MKNLTNGQLIEILLKRNLDEPVDIFVDFALMIEEEDSYHPYTEKDGLCYDEEYNQLVVFAGDFEA